MTSKLVQRSAKVPRDESDDQERCEDEERFTKAKRHDIGVPMAEVDIKLAEKLDNLLKISDTRKPRFFMNRPKTKTSKKICDNEPSTVRNEITDKILLKHKDFTKEQLRQRLADKYDTLVPELSPNRHAVKIVKILSATESLELAKEQAKKQLESQLELSSVGGNQRASKNGIGPFKFQDGYELPSKCFSHSKKLPSHKHKSVTFEPNATSTGVMESVRYFKPDENEDAIPDYSHHDQDESDEDDESDDDDDDEDEDDDDDETDGDLTDDAEPYCLTTLAGKELVDKR